MHGALTISLVIPCFNEELGLGALLADIPPCVDEVVVVDNNSTDRTADVARRFGARVVPEHRQGYGSAYQRGLPAASGDIVVTCDGDGTYPVDRILALVEMLVKDDLDFISACRFPLTRPAVMPRLNFAGNQIVTVLANLMFGLQLTDSQSGMWVFRRTVLERIRPRFPGMAFSQEIKLLAFRHPALACREVYVPYGDRLGQSKLRPWRHGWELIVCLVRQRLRRASA